MSARDREEYQRELLIVGQRMGRALALAGLESAMRDSGQDVMVIDAMTVPDQLIREIEVSPIAKQPRHHTHPNSPKASHRSERGRR